MQNAAQLRLSLATAIAAGLALHAGCDNTPPSRTPSGESGDAPGDAAAAATSAPSATAVAIPSASPSATPSAAPPVLASATATSSAVAAVTATPVVPTPDPHAKPEWCKTTVPYCLKPQTPPPSFGNVPSPPPGQPDSNTYDKRGCVALDSIPTSCSGMVMIAGPSVRGGKCCYDICQGPVPPCGRPFLVDGDARVASSVPRAGWSASPSVTGLDMAPALRARLRDAWLADASMEHASIASFGRFALELLAVGAPAELVAAAHRAALDEVLHARLCYEEAARYAAPGQASVGPGPLDLLGVTLRTDLALVAEAAVHEGCVGETFAALAAAQARDACEDVATRALLSRLADDEAAHAALAWRFLSWALASGGDAVRTSVARAFELSLARPIALAAPQNGDPDALAWRRAGRLDAATLAALWTRVREDVVRPCAAELV